MDNNSLLSISKTKAKKRSMNLFVRELQPVQVDAEAYKKIAHGEGIHEYVSFLEANTIDMALKRINDAQNNSYEKIYGLFNKANRLLAVFLVHDITLDDDAFRTASIHYFVAERFQRKGYCVKGLKLLEEEFSNIFDFFYFSIRKSNVSSRKVQEKIGSTLEKETKNHIFFRLKLAA